MVLRIVQKIELKAYVDASFSTYEDMKSVTAVALMIGDATVYRKIGKQKIVTRSFTGYDGDRLQMFPPRLNWYATRTSSCMHIYSDFNLIPDCQSMHMNATCLGQ
jgi:hypothetical protein